MNNNDLKLGITIVICITVVILAIVGCRFTYSLYYPEIPAC